MPNKDWVKCILLDDSKNIIKRIPDNSIDFIFTDPPYNIGKHSTGNIPLPGRAAMNNDVADWDWIDFNPEEWADEFIRILKPNGNLFIFTSYNQIGRWYNCLDHKFDTTNFMIWHKTNPAPKIFKAGFLNSCEMIFTCWNKGHTWNFISQAEMHNFFESAVCMRPERLSNPKHPAQKPLALLKKIISIASNPGDIIFDPFMGVGSIGVAALNLGRRFIGVEISPKYFSAAKSRIDNSMTSFISPNNTTNSTTEIVQEPSIAYRHTPIDFPSILFNKKPQQYVNTPQIYQDSKQELMASTGLKPLLKWAGGKEKELKYIIPNLPTHFKTYYEPFVGGGSVFMALTAEKYVINDLSDELINLYKAIALGNNQFFNLSYQIDNTWSKIHHIAAGCTELKNIYLDYRNDSISYETLKELLSVFCDNRQRFETILGKEFNMHQDVLDAEIRSNLSRKFKRMKELELTKHLLPDSDIDDNIECALKSAYYMYFRYLYNSKSILQENPILHCALFYFIRNYCYSGMFRYNDKGAFNVPYGGIAYNSKSLSTQLKYYQSPLLREHFRTTTIDNLDFEQFLNKYQPTKDDFIFLDPPYDSEFSTYAQNQFFRQDQKRLADYMINRCKAKWMLIIKNTDFIYNLYNRPGINIRTFDKEYVVSFMNRNDKKAVHLLITNY